MTPVAQFKPMRVHVGDAPVTVHTAGSGRPLVLCHSLLADRTSFDLVAPKLAEGFYVIALDLPGFGASPPVTGGLAAAADRVAAAVRALDLRERPIMLGNGYGGFVTLQAAIRHPGLAQRLVLADCGACFNEPGRAAFRAMAAKAQEGGLAAVADVAMRRLFAPEYQAQHPELIAQRKKRFLALDPATFLQACADLAALDLRAELASVQVPALVLVGEMDEATPPPMSRELAAGLPQARLAILPGCAHVPQLQEPEQFLAAVDEFIGLRPLH